jgi:GTP-binding protein
MKAVTNLNRTDLLPAMLPFWIDSSKQEQLSSSPACDIDLVGSVVRLYCRQQLVDAAEKIAASAHVFISEPPASAEVPSGVSQRNHSDILPELALGFISQGSVFKAQTSLTTLLSLGLKLDIDIAKKVLKQFLTHGRSDTIRRALQTLLQLNSLDDHESVQMITNYYLRSVDFVTGAVSMKTLPAPHCAEVCFIGRSNVGKSSLINMLCNRKSLAFTSKTPGKTSEFNYFAAHGVVGVNKEPHKFYLVDLPGVGFARRTKGTRQGWASLLNEYATSRENLRAVYHLVDSRHGLLDADEECLSILEHLPERTMYVIVLTKADKHNENEKTTAAMSAMIASIQREVQKRTARQVPIILTSSETKRGGARMLSHVLDAVAPEPPVLKPEPANQ